MVSVWTIVLTKLDTVYEIDDRKYKRDCFKI